MSRRRRLPPASLPVVGALALALGVVGCQQPQDNAERPGDVAQGRQAFERYGCGSCHQVAGIRGADGRVGPDLDGIHEQRIVGGVLPNTPENLAAWIMDPQEHDPATAMPDLGVGEDDATDIAAFLLQD